MTGVGTLGDWGLGARHSGPGIDEKMQQERSRGRKKVREDRRRKKGRKNINKKRNKETIKNNNTKEADR